MIVIKNTKILKWSLLLILIALAENPVMIRAQQKVGAETLKITKNNVDYKVVPLSELFFGYQPPVDVEHLDGNVTKGAKKPMPIPKEITGLNGKKLAIKGFIIPLANSGSRVNEFLFADELVSCLFCAMLGYDQWILVKTVNPKGFKISDDQYEEPVTIYGTLQLGPFYEDGQFTCLYRLKAEGFIPERKKFLGIF